MSPSVLSTGKSFVDEWTSVSTTIPNGGRDFFASVQLKNELYFVGGLENFKTHLNTVTSVQLYDGRMDGTPALTRSKSFLCCRRFEPRPIRRRWRLYWQQGQG